MSSIKQHTGILSKTLKEEKTKKTQENPKKKEEHIKRKRGQEWKKEKQTLTNEKTNNREKKRRTPGQEERIFSNKIQCLDEYGSVNSSSMHTSSDVVPVPIIRSQLFERCCFDKIGPCWNLNLKSSSRSTTTKTSIRVCSARYTIRTYCSLQKTPACMQTDICTQFASTLIF
jgi:hypothetical protein